MVAFANINFVLCEGKGLMMLRETVEISLAGRAPKQDPTLFALALCARYQVSLTLAYIP